MASATKNGETGPTGKTSETGVTDRRTDGRTGIDLEWLAPLKTDKQTNRMVYRVAE